ncbi:MAG: endolytic transglycosylase MltG, partial [Clostridia bacterium]|nr:endolytic transglycosylase MltG [Clostridia bacterium]
MAINEKRTHFSIWKTFLTMFFIAVLGFILLGVTVVKDAKDIEIGQSLTIEIPDGAGASVVSELLHENGAVKYPTVFRLCSRLGNFDGQYKPGPVTLHNGMSYLSILELLISERNIVKVVIPEGYTIRQIAETVAASGLCSADEFYAVLDASLYDYRFLKDIPERENRLEGYLFPATYEFFPGASAQEIVDAMLKRFDEVFTDEYYKRAEEVNVTVDEVITMASIVERETNADGERAKVAGVFYNRINENMPLQSCATVQYILGENKPVLSESDTKIDSPYNTYKNPGLPVG